jgi:hypothetical protein
MVWVGESSRRDARRSSGAHVRARQLGVADGLELHLPDRLRSDGILPSVYGW